jgi:hypothetical protein
MNAETMTDPPAKPRRRWKRWATLALVLAIGCGVWMMSREGETVRKSRALQIGMTDVEVDAIMGPPIVTHVASRAPVRQYAAYATPVEAGLRRLRRDVYAVLEALNLLVDDSAGWPVEVRFDESGRADEIRRGNEVVGR